MKIPAPGEKVINKYRPWLMWFLLISLHLITSFHRVSFNVIADFLTAEFNLTGLTLGNLAAAYTYMYVLMQIPGGILVDRLGSKKIAVLTALSMGMGSLLMGISTSAIMVFWGRMLIGLGGSVILINIFKFQSVWFKPGQFATLSGLALLISGSGALLAATPFALMVEQYGWRPIFIIIGIITFIIALSGWNYIRDHPEIGQALPSGSGSVKMFVVPASISYREALKSVLSNKKLLIPFLMNFGTYGGFIIFSGTWGVSFLIHVYGLPVQEASIFMVLTYVGYMIGAPLIGLISDRVGSRIKPAAFLIALFCLSWMVIVFWPGGPVPLQLLYFLSFSIGLGTAGSILSFPMAREYSPEGQTGAATAAVNLGVFLGLAVLQPLIGYILDIGWTGSVIEGARIYPLIAYRTGFLGCLIFGLTAFISLFSVNESVNSQPDS